MGSEAECGCGPIGVGLGSGTEGFASGDLASWREGQPGGEVLLGGPAGHVQADLANELEGGLGINAFDGGEIDPGDAEEVGADVEGGLILLPFAAAGGFVKRSADAAILERVQAVFDLGVAGRDLLAVEVEELHLRKLESIDVSQPLMGRI